MIERLKVSDFYRQKQIVCIREIQYLHRAFFQNDQFYFTTKDAPILLHQYSLKQKTISQTFQIPLETIKSIKIFQGIMCMIFEQNEYLWIYNSKHQLLKLHSHYLGITCLTVYFNSVITGSKDMTIRIWKQNNDSLIQDNKLHILSGHTAQITCFLNISTLLLSGSKDKSVTAWKNVDCHTKRLFQSEILQLSLCQESSQFIVYEANQTINILNINSLLRQQNLVINRVIKGINCVNLRCINEMDDNFIQVVSKNLVQIAQINLGETIGRIKYNFDEIMTAKCLRRMTLFAINGKGLYMINF